MSTIIFMLIIGIEIYWSTSISTTIRQQLVFTDLIVKLITLLIKYYSIIITWSLHGPFLIELSILISASFNHINQLIVSLSNDQTKTDNLSQTINKIRSTHNKIIELTIKVNSMFKRNILIIYPINLLQLIVNINSLIVNHQISWRLVNLNHFPLIYYSIAPIFIIHVTLRLLEVNCNSFASLNQIYNLSHREQLTIKSKYEIGYFLFRINDKNIGFTFWKLMIIGPNFFSSMITLIVTMIISLPLIENLI
ncbi:uncharacterized protein LOC128393294 [Panonychus citri]|uniref:uncharacterized protein LOC128393294 n=1 Tax=Panonychus citri TaxID=50023 RepID=UPI0023077A70|nr:uncharacterized protein LOC128393294 [Panonychus citri]